MAGENRGIGYFEQTFQNQINDKGQIVDFPQYAFRKKFGDGPDENPVEPGRYRIVWMPACPHAHKVIITWKLLGLDKVISLATTSVHRTPEGWAFTNDPGGVDPVLKVHKLHELYLRTDPSFKGRSTVPTIVDVKTGLVANNDHFWIPQYLDTAWKKYHKKGAPDLYPEDLREEIDKLNRYVFIRINDGFYECGFARSQEQYDKGYQKIFEALDLLDQRLEDRRFLFGDFITDTDIRLYPSLVRYYFAYHLCFRVNRNSLPEFKNLWPYARDLYQTPGFRDTTYFDLIKESYQASEHLMPLWGNVHGLVAAGPRQLDWEEPTDRAKLSSHESKFRLEH